MKKITTGRLIKIGELMILKKNCFLWILCLSLFSISFLNAAQSSDKNRDKKKSIFLATIPKSGTHLLVKAVKMMTDLESKFIRLYNPDNLTNFLKSFKFNQPKIIFAHLFPPLDLIRKEYSDKFIKIIIVRDFRDVMISFMYHLCDGKPWIDFNNETNPICTQFDLEEFKALTENERLNETIRLSAYCRSPKTCVDLALKWMNDPTVLVCRFEDLVGDKGGGNNKKQRETLKKLAKHIGCDLGDDEIKQIANKLFGDTWSFRKGQIGGWENTYNEENKEMFKKYMGQALIDLGYEKDNNW